MDNEDLDALAAEYVLGTLASDERAHAEALIAIDPGFGDLVRQWERRLGELNVMVEAVEPPAQIWDKIKSDIGMPATGNDIGLAPSEPGPPASPAKTESASDAARSDSAPLAAAAASPSAETGVEAKPDAKEIKPPATTTPLPVAAIVPPLAVAAAPQAGRSAEVISLRRRIRRWRRIAGVAGLVAAALAAVIVISQVDPALMPASGIHIPQLIARLPLPATKRRTPTATSRLVAVLQREPSSPAFLLTIDPANKTLTVRRVAAQAEAGHSFELWLIPANSAAPQALGVVGEQEFTQPKLPANFDLGVARTATYIVSYEPPGGSKTGAPSGPTLFTGRLVEAVPAVPPPKT